MASKSESKETHSKHLLFLYEFSVVRPSQKNAIKHYLRHVTYYLYPITRYLI